MLNPVKKIINERKINQVEKALLSDDYNKDREYIIQSIKECIKNKDYKTAQDYFDRYHDVAYNDKVFCTLERETHERLMQKEELLSLKTILEVTPNDEYEKRYELSNKILAKEPDNQECKNEIIRCEQALGLRPVVASDLRLGRIVTSDLIGYYEPNNPDVKIAKGGVTVRLHTHGVSIKHSNGIYRIHYSQIISLEYNSEGAVSGLLAIAAGAIIGGLIGDGFGDALDGANFASDFVDSKDVLNILYWDIESDQRKVLTIKCKNKTVIEEFINDYNREIEITKRTKRTPKSEINYVKRICIVLGIIVMLFMLPSLCSEPNTNKASENNNISVEPSQPNDLSSNQKADSGIWETLTSASCTINQSGTTLTVIGTNPSNATIEMTGISVKSCKIVEVTFDNQSSKSVNCAFIYDGAIKIEADRRLIKNMRGSANMKVTVPLDNGDSKIIQYSLTGFSKACEWTK